MTPHVFNEARDGDGNLVERYKPKPWVQAVTPEVAADMRDMMVEVVERGTGTRGRIPGVQVAGKTGTAQTGRDTSHAWFIAFAPAQKPKLAIAVMLIDADGDGGEVAAPIAQDILGSVLP